MTGPSLVRCISGTTAALAAAMTLLPAAVNAADAGRIDAYVTPYYNSSGPMVRVGSYSMGLASKSRCEFVATIAHMKQRWAQLTFMQLYVGAIRLYDLGYRDEATYWFYTAQYRGRQFALLADRRKLGEMGDRGFELATAQNAFFEVVGPQINGYAFGHLDALLAIIRTVRDENRTVPNLDAIYPGVAFVGKKDWERGNRTIGDGLGKLAAYLSGQRAAIARDRAGNGTQARFDRLTSTPLPGRC
jgi:hypothetical protein